MTKTKIKSIHLNVKVRSDSFIECSTHKRIEMWRLLSSSSWLHTSQIRKRVAEKMIWIHWTILNFSWAHKMMNLTAHLEHTCYWIFSSGMEAEMMYITSRPNHDISRAIFCCLFFIVWIAGMEELLHFSNKLKNTGFVINHINALIALSLWDSWGLALPSLS